MSAHLRSFVIIGAGLSVGAGIIHFAFGPEHVEELGALGYGFYLSGALQVVWAIALALLLLPRGRNRPALDRGLAWSGIAINGAILGAWAFARMFGLPAGETPWTPEAIGRPDAIAGLLEVILVAGLLGWLRGWNLRRPVSARLLAAGAAITLSVVAVGTVLAITPDAEGHADGHAAMVDMDMDQAGSGSR